MQKFRTLGTLRRELETEPRRVLNGHAGGNPGYSQRCSYGPPRHFPTLPGCFPTRPPAETRMQEMDASSAYVTSTGRDETGLHSVLQAAPGAAIRRHPVDPSDDDDRDRRNSRCLLG